MKTSENVTIRKMSAYWLTLLLFNGINVYPGSKNSGLVRLTAAAYPWLICGFWVFIMCSVLSALATRDGGYEGTIELLSLFTGSSSTLALFAIGVRKRPEFVSMLSLVRHEFWDDGRLAGAADLLFSGFARTYGTIFPVANAVMCVAPVAWAASHRNFDSPTAFIFGMWTPWPRHTAAEYAAVYAVQFVVSISVLTSITGMVLAMVLIVNEMQVQMDALVRAVDNLPVKHLYDRDNDDGPALQQRDDHYAIRGLVQCVKHHQMLIRYFNHFKSYFNLIFIVDIMYVTVMTCLCASSVLLANGLLFRIKMISLLTVVISQFFFYCLIGEKFSKMNEQLGYCVYFKLVKCKDLKLSRIGYLILLRTQAPLQLTAMTIKTYSASLFTFGVTMRSAYAGLNVLYNSLQNRHKS